MEHNGQFSFHYSAQQRSEVEDIRKKYLPKEENKMEQLRFLHRIPTAKATRAALVLGILGALILGTGMSLCMTELGDAFGLGKTPALLIGAGIGLVGMLLAALAYPVYNCVLKKQRKKIAPEILRLSDELLK